jgi:hypothetical protein
MYLNGKKVKIIQGWIPASAGMTVNYEPFFTASDASVTLMGNGRRISNEGSPGELELPCRDSFRA